MIAALTVSAVPAVIFGGQRFGLTTLIERIYAATVTGAVGVWLAMSTALGPSRRPLPQVLLFDGVVLAVPWWAHRRRRAKVRVERTLAVWPEIAQTIGLAGSRVMSAVVDVWGWRARFALARGQTIADVIARLPAIESALGTICPLHYPRARRRSRRIPRSAGMRRAGTRAERQAGNGGG